MFDEALICHVGAVRGDDPVVLPMTHGRAGDRLYLHGSPAAGLLAPAGPPERVCATATIVDGAVFAASVFSHSFNYRSAAVFGPLRPLTDPEEKREALRHVVDHLAPGRWKDARQPSDAELRKTAVVEMVMESWSAKSRSGPPVETIDADRVNGVWSGVIPVGTVATADPLARDADVGAAVPAYLAGWGRAPAV